jgi:quercetin dioxygenase-like cupin family protein
MFKSTRQLLPLIFLLPVVPAHQAAKRETRLKPVPVYEESHHHVVFRNQYARLLDVRIPAHEATGFHIHPNPLTGVTIEDQPGWEQILGQEKKKKEAPETWGTPFDNWDRKRPYTHRVGNDGNEEIHYVASEWLAPSGIRSERLPDSGSRKFFKEGEFVRIYKIKLAPGESSEPHTHAAPGFTIQALDGEVEDTGTQPGATGGKGAGAWSWRNPGHQHRLYNRGNKPVEIVEIDWR